MLESDPLPSAVDDAAEIMAYFPRVAKKPKKLPLRSLAPLLLSVLSLLTLTTFFTS